MTTNNQKLLDSIDAKDIQAFTMCSIVGETEVDFDHVAVVDILEDLTAMMILFKEIGNAIELRLVVKIIDLGDHSCIKGCELYKKGNDQNFEPIDISIEIFNYIIKRNFQWSPTPGNSISDYLLSARF